MTVNDDDSTMCFIMHQLAYIEAINSTFADLILRNTASKGIFVTYINDCATRMIPLNYRKNILFTSWCGIVYIDGSAKRHLFDTDITDYTYEPGMGIRFNERIYRKIPFLESVLPMHNSYLVDLVNLCFADVEERVMSYTNERTCTNSDEQIDYAKDILDCIDSPTEMYDNTYSDYRDYFDYQLSWCV